MGSSPNSDLPPRLSGRSGQPSTHLCYRYPRPWSADTLLFPFKNPKINNKCCCCCAATTRTCCLGIGFGGLKGHFTAFTGLPALERSTSARDTVREKGAMKGRLRAAVLCALHLAPHFWHARVLKSPKHPRHENTCSLYWNSPAKSCTCLNEAPTNTKGRPPAVDQQ